MHFVQKKKLFNNGNTLESDTYMRLNIISFKKKMCIDGQDSFV